MVEDSLIYCPFWGVLAAFTAEEQELGKRQEGL